MNNASWLEDIGYYDDDAASFKRIMLYGESGGGKTQAAASFEAPVFIDFEKGGLTLRKLHVPFIAALEPKGLISKVFSILTAAENAAGPFGKGGVFEDRKTLVLDSISSFSNTALYELIAQTGKNPLDTKATFDEYGKLLNTQIALGKALIRISQRMNVVVTAHADVNKDDMTGAMYGGPLLVGQYRQLIGGQFDEVYFLTTEGTKDAIKHVAYTSKFNIYFAKTRLDLPYKMALTDDQGQPIPLASYVK